ncbi:hypothetical protein [Catellatospora paridis]|uniref:hypothetical protein n=1 Tax=Catellatospora paridis TaxID=1617086 RepID=UPI0012D37F11|nr:hypothetical protein [Catellatospora paridis]
MSVTRNAAATVKFAVAAAALTAAFAIGLAGGADAGQNSALGEVICPADTHWSIQLGTCVRDDTL